MTTFILVMMVMCSNPLQRAPDDIPGKMEPIQPQPFEVSVRQPTDGFSHCHQHHHYHHDHLQIDVILCRNPLRRAPDEIEKDKPGKRPDEPTQPQPGEVSATVLIEDLETGEEFELDDEETEL